MITLSAPSTIARQRTSTSIISRFFNWADNQQENKYAWLAVALAVHGCFLTPLTAMIVMATSYNFVLFMAAIGAMAIALVTNLAALPTKITVPAFFLSILIDVLIIALAFTINF
jgi:hypothetical protein